MPIPEQFIDELVARSEISDVVSSYVHLTRKGNNLWGLCPFHNEKTPSFRLCFPQYTRLIPSRAACLSAPISRSRISE